MHFFNFKLAFSSAYSATVQANLFLQAILNLLGGLGPPPYSAQQAPFSTR